MKKSRLIFIIFLLLVSFLLIDFPGAKIVLYGIVIAVVLNKIYAHIVGGKFKIKRYMDTNRVFAGLKENTSLVISNEMPIPIHSLIVNDHTDLNISAKASHPFLFSLSENGNSMVDYDLYGRKRGLYKIGPTTVKFTDIMGIYSFKSEIDTVKEVVVFPNILKINNLNYRSMQPYGNIKNKLPIFEDPSLIIGMREYHFGDEIKRINWKVSAKYDRLFVNTYQPSISSGSVIILDMNRDDYNFRNKDYYIERAIEVAATLVKELFILRQEIALASNCRIDNTDSILFTQIGKGEVHFTSILSDLSIMEPNKKIPLHDVLNRSILNMSWGLSVYIITPGLDEECLYRLIDFYQSGHSVTVINTGPEIKKELSLWSVGFMSYFAEIEGNIINLMRI